MSRVPLGISASTGGAPFGCLMIERYQQANLYGKGGLVPQGISAEIIAKKWNLSRRELDEFAAESHRRAAAAWADGRFDAEVATLKAPAADGSLVEVAMDETIRPATTADVLAGLKPAFYNEVYAQRFPQIDWRVTAGNSSPVNDGAAAVLITSAAKAAELGLRPRARLHSFTVVGDDPLYMLTGIIPATERVLKRAGLRIDDIDAFEVNEAFASVVLAWQRETGVDLAKVNVNGGATAIGHPLGASGARLMTSLLTVLEQTGGRYGLQTMCEAGGLANATIIERL
jgi:acetyl-CoA acyltransferase